MKIIAVLAGFAAAAQFGFAQGRMPDDFCSVCKELDSLIYERTSVRGELEINAVMRRGKTLDFYFSSSLSDLPWTQDDCRWFRNELEGRFPEKYAGYSLGRVSSRGEKIEDLVTGELHFDGRPADCSYRVRNRGASGKPIVENMDEPPYPYGLDGRHIALWQSHGLYYEQKEARWEWQRPCLFQTVEDLFTQSFVLPFLVPMLENAGAYVLLPRERDVQTYEIIADNDPDFRDGRPLSEDSPEHLRLRGTYEESGNWKDAGTGFADAKMYYEGTDNPFTMGSARMAACTGSRENPDKVAEIVWTPDIPERGEYAVYVSYKTMANSTAAAHYTVRHLGGETEFSVNQRMGGGMWVYLGTFEFEKGTSGCVMLDNVVSPVNQGRNTVVTADAVKIGGGYGNIARSVKCDPCSLPETSGMPRFTEAARYWLQWSGADSTIFSQNESENDYADDFMCRGDWSAYLSGGSAVNPGQKGKNIPVDLTFALHSDAGTTPNDSTVGTLAIYTLKSENRRKLPAGEDRRTSREFANLVQSQIVCDIRHGFDPDWSRRFLWDRGYRESRTPASPSMLCELLSHQNLADMKSGLDPSFRFTVSRAIYKGMLKYLSNRYGRSYVVQPLPVNSFSAVFRDGKIRLAWQETRDAVEPTAAAESFIIQTRVDDGVFDKGIRIDAAEAAMPGPPSGGQGERRFSYDIPFEPGHVYGFRVIACNSGGKSFPSEILCAGTPALPGNRHPDISEDSPHIPDSCVLVVNNFHRISAPAWFDSPEYAGFDNGTDSGVPYIREIAFTGEQYQFRRDLPWQSDDCPGFGASHNDFSGSVIAGNTFDYPYVHGKAILNAGYPFCSASAGAFVRDTSLCSGEWCLDLICGKQVTVKSASDSLPDRFAIFPEEMQGALARYTSSGGNILVSGAHIGTDIKSGVYPAAPDSVSTARAEEFAAKVLGFRYVSGHASRTGEVVPVQGKAACPDIASDSRIVFNNRPDTEFYSVENPDGIAPADTAGTTFLRYRDTRISAGVCTDFGTYRSICIGFPIEVITDEESLNMIMKSSLDYLKTDGREMR